MRWIWVGIIVFTQGLIVTCAKSDTPEGSKCKNINCKPLPDSKLSSCKIYNKSNRGVDQKLGQLKGCCPLYICTEGNGKTFLYTGIENATDKVPTTEPPTPQPMSQEDNGNKMTSSSTTPPAPVVSMDWVINSSTEKSSTITYTTTSKAVVKEVPMQKETLKPATISNQRTLQVIGFVRKRRPKQVTSSPISLFARLINMTSDHFKPKRVILKTVKTRQECTYYAKDTDGNNLCVTVQK